MKQSEKDLIMSYFVNEEMRLDDEFIELRNRIRFRRIDISDCVELICVMQRIADFHEFSIIVMRLLHLGSGE